MSDNKENIEINQALIEEWANHYRVNEAETERIYISINEDLGRLFGLKHETLGRLLKCHLILEHYINKFLEVEIRLPADNEGNFRFIQKVILIENAKPTLDYFLKGVREINKIRNRFAHRLDPSIDLSSIPTVKMFASTIPDQGTKLEDPIDYIEKFTTMFCHIIGEQSTERGRELARERDEIFRKYR